MVKRISQVHFFHHSVVLKALPPRWSPRHHYRASKTAVDYHRYLYWKIKGSVELAIQVRDRPMGDDGEMNHPVLQNLTKLSPKRKESLE